MYARFFMGDFIVKHTKRSASALTVDQALGHRNNKKERSSPEIEHIETYENEIH